MLNAKERHKAQIRAWQKANPDKVREAKQRYRATEKGKARKRLDDQKYAASGGRAETERRRGAKPLSPARKAARARWSRANKAYWAAERAHRRMLARFPLSTAERAAVYAMYEFCKIFPMYEVDHILPVKGEQVCGLHVPGNLQVILRTANRQKSNKVCLDSIQPDDVAIIYV